MRDTIRIPVGDASQVAEARRTVQGLVSEMGFTEEEAGKVAIATTEAASNLMKHAGGGEILARREGLGRLEVLALDKGPGMENVRECLQDGYSTTGTMGGGLGAISRLATLTDIFAVPGKGTAVLIRFDRTAPESPLDAAGFSVPMEGETVCGDAWALQGKTICVVDGLGHGAPAAIAAQIVMESFAENWHLEPCELLEELHRNLRPTRGAAVSVCKLDAGRQVARYAGIGNISGVIFRNGTARHLVSMNGTLGHEVRRFQEFEYVWDDSCVLAMASDGLSARWDLTTYPGLLHRSPALIAGVLYRDYGRGRDDATAVVAREAA